MAVYNNKIVTGNGEVLIDLTGDTAKKEQVLKNYTFHTSDGAIETGTCTYNADVTSATAEVAEVLVGETFFARTGEVKTGTMPNRGKQTGTISTVNGTVSIQQGYHDGSGSVSISPVEAAKIVPANIKAGVVILGQTGTYGGEAITAQTKTVTPTFAEGGIDVLPDEGYDYLSQVHVNPIPMTKVLNAANGYTVTIG